MKKQYLSLLLIGAVNVGIMMPTALLASDPAVPGVSQAAPPQTAPPQRFRRAESECKFQWIETDGAT